VIYFIGECDITDEHHRQILNCWRIIESLGINQKINFNRQVFNDSVITDET